jgi:hypothetical protein
MNQLFKTIHKTSPTEVKCMLITRGVRYTFWYLTERLEHSVCKSIYLIALAR